MSDITKISPVAQLLKIYSFIQLMPTFNLGETSI